MEESGRREREKRAVDEARERLSSSSSSSSSSSRVGRPRNDGQNDDDDDDDESKVSLYVTLKNENLYNVYAMETMAYTMRSRNAAAFEQLSIGLFAAPDADSSTFLRNAAGTRAKVEPIFSETSWETFAERLEKTTRNFVLPPMQLEGEKEPYHPPIALIYETVARFQPQKRDARRKPSDELLAFCTSRVKRLSPVDVGYKYGVRGTFAGVDPREPDVIRAKEYALRFVVLETENGYAFALASYAPDMNEAHSVVKSSLTWAQKPANFSSGTRFEVARALVNTIAAVNCSSSSNNSSRKRLSEMIFLDPFCGSGTLCVAAKQLGFGNVIGSDAKEHLIEKSRRNARWFFSAASGAQAVPSEASSSSPFPQFQQANAFIRTPFTHDPSKTVVVSNLPFGRNVDFVAPPYETESSSTTSHLQLALETLKPLARTHAFISGIPIGEEMVKLGYENVSQIALDRRGKMFVAISCSNNDDDHDWKSNMIKVSDENVWFTVDEALRYDEIRQANASKRAAMRMKDGEEHDEDTTGCAIEIAKTNPNALKVIVDLSYEHDSTRALRSVAKQLCEITSISKKSKGDLRVTFASFSGDIKYESETFFNADTWNKHVEMLPNAAEECDVVHQNNIIYLSPDAEDSLTISELRDPSNIFIVGGIVDLKTRGVPTSRSKALSLGLAARKLPVKTLRPDQTHDVLNIDAVVKILRLAWEEEEEEEEAFHRAFEQVLPKRQEKEKPKRLKR